MCVSVCACIIVSYHITLQTNKQNRRRSALQKAAELTAAAGALKQSEVFRLHDDTEDAAMLLTCQAAGEAALASA